MYQEVFLIHQSKMENLMELLPQYSAIYLGNTSLLPNATRLKFPIKEVSELFAAKLLELGIISIRQYNRKMQ
jgi:hypothetical protein